MKESERNSLLTQGTRFKSKMDVLQAQEAAAGETAYLIEKTDQQSFITLIAGVILSGEPSSADIPI